MELNPNLKIIVMSATIDTKLFSDYFNGAPVMNVPGITYPVKINYLENIPINLNKTKELIGHSSPYVASEDVIKVIKYIHKTRPEGAVLCFLPGWDEISKIKYYLQESLDDSNAMVLALHSKLSLDEQNKIFQ